MRILITVGSSLVFLAAAASGFAVTASTSVKGREELFRRTALGTRHRPLHNGVNSNNAAAPSRQIILKNSKSDDDDDVEFDSLDVMLERARQRNKIGLRLTKIQAIMSTPVGGLPASLTRGDIVLVAASIAIGSIGFAIGLTVGKLTAGYLPRRLLPPAVLQFWPVFLAILCDQLL